MLAIFQKQYLALNIMIFLETVLFFHFEKVYKKDKLPVLGNLLGIQEQSVPYYSP